MDEEPLLEGAAGAVDVAKVVDRRPLGVDPGLQRLLDRVAQRLELPTRQPTGRTQRMDPGPEQRLVGVDVADAGDPALVEQKGLDRRRATARGAPQIIRA